MPKKLSRFVLLLLAVIMMLQIVGASVATAEAIDSENILWSSPNAVSLRRARIRLNSRSGPYNGNTHKLSLTVTLNGEELAEGRDYVISGHRTSGSSAKRYRVRFVVIGIGHYRGFVTRSVYYRINRIAQNLEVTLNVQGPDGGEIEVNYQDLRDGTAGGNNNNTFPLTIRSTGLEGQEIISRLVWRRPAKIKIRRINGDTHIYLPRNLRKGTYIIRVYARAGGNYNKSATQRLTIKVT